MCSVRVGSTAKNGRSGIIYMSKLTRNTIVGACSPWSQPIPSAMAWTTTARIADYTWHHLQTKHGNNYEMPIFLFLVRLFPDMILYKHRHNNSLRFIKRSQSLLCTAQQSSTTGEARAKRTGKRHFTHELFKNAQQHLGQPQQELLPQERLFSHTIAIGEMGVVCVARGVGQGVSRGKIQLVCCVPWWCGSQTKGRFETEGHRELLMWAALVFCLLLP